jgi:ribosomal protein S18 acetylase RimI-like enzyme
VPLIHIERLGPAQLGAVREAMQVFAHAFDEQGTFFSAPPSDAYFERLLSNSHFVMLAARINGTLVGALAAYELVKYEQERSEFYIYDLAVAEPFRRRGVARRLIEALKPIARSAGAWVIFVQADRGDEPAVALYRSMGTEEEPLHFDIPVD